MGGGLYFLYLSPEELLVFFPFFVGSLIANELSWRVIDLKGVLRSTPGASAGTYTASHSLNVMLLQLN